MKTTKGFGLGAVAESDGSVDCLIFDKLKLSLSLKLTL